MELEGVLGLVLMLCKLVEPMRMFLGLSALHRHLRFCISKCPESANIRDELFVTVCTRPEGGVVDKFINFLQLL